jgi:pyruvate dehydrogenase E2 component (dihydrolipoamide acetyltransferase)
VAIEVCMPQLGLTMLEGEIISWMVSVGDVVHRGQPLAEIETDKIVSELESPGDGIVRQILVKEGDSCVVAGLLAVIAAPGEEYEPTAAQEGPKPAAATQSTSTTRMAEPSPTVIGSHRASPNARRVARERGISLERVSAGSGAGGRIVGLDLQGVPDKPPVPLLAKVTPLARRMAEEAGVDLTRLAGSGKGGRITREDIEQAQRPFGTDSLEVIPLTGVRGLIADRMAASAHSTAAVTLTTEADATELAGLRDQLSNRRGAGIEARVPFDAILVKLVSIALREHPRLNARLSGDGIQVMRDVDIAVAVETDRGLLTTVVKKADTKAVLQIADELAALVARARSGKSHPEDLEGGTFTLTNLGMHEIDVFTPIINPPQCGVLGVGRICPRPVVRGDSVCIRRMVWLSLTFDHRMVDGAPAARFLQCVKKYVEDPDDRLGAL